MPAPQNESSKMKITKRQLRRIIKEEAQKLFKEQDTMKHDSAHSHHWPTVEWNEVHDLVDMWELEELKSFDMGDPSMVRDDISAKEAKEFWEAEVYEASAALREELAQRIKDLALVAMKDMTDRLINGDFSK
jgi:hypothetical protein